MHSVLHPGGAQAHLVAILWWWLLGVATTVYAVVAVGMLVAAARRRRARPDWETDGPPRSAARDRTAIRWVGASAGATMCVSVAFLIVSIRTSAAIARHPARP